MDSYVENPEKIIESLHKEILQKINKISKEYGVEYNEIKEYIRVNEPNLFDEIENLYDLIDTNILERYYKKQLTMDDFNNWKNNVAKWKEKMIEGLNKFIEFESLSLVA